MKSYKDDIDATCRKQQHLVGETDSDLKYVSSAYIEKYEPHILTSVKLKENLLYSTEYIVHGSKRCGYFCKKFT